MSFKVSDIFNDIKSSIESEIESAVESRLSDHMDAQPYSVECSYCGASLSVAKFRVDGDFDVHIAVEPCDCQKDND